MALANSTSDDSPAKGTKIVLRVVVGLVAACATAVAVAAAMSKRRRRR